MQANNSGEQPAVLALASGETFCGSCFGATEPAVGEVVFNTAMSGYQEIATDPSYRGQLVCMTSPHIGNVGVNARDSEAASPQVAGFIVRALARTVSSWRAEGSFGDLLSAAGAAGIAGIDTRMLTRLLRDRGSINGCIMAISGDSDIERALEAARSCPLMTGRGLAVDAGSLDPDAGSAGSWDPAADAYAPGPANGPAVAVVDCGCKRAIVRELAARGLQAAAAPYRSSAEELAELGPHGVVLSNGPGDPAPLSEAVSLAASLLQMRIPLLGICLGHQVLALAAGARVEKMKFGHHGSNHPVCERSTGRVAITSQNHGFAIEADSLPDTLEVTYSSLFDGTIQGLRHRKSPALSVQGHPEASPGPREMGTVFDEFADLVRSHAQAQQG